MQRDRREGSAAEGPERGADADGDVALVAYFEHRYGNLPDCGQMNRAQCWEGAPAFDS